MTLPKFRGQFSSGPLHRHFLKVGFVVQFCTNVV